ncbi:MAG: DUF4115 domain-containing protein [Proteobacteria bacterium]|nr:DUF4115 domain-containing protein [Pseudomonadota bacterium]
MSDKEKDMTVGEMLIAARTNGRRKRELQTVARQLCIKEEFLDALEKGNYSEIPELIYILGFARNYAVELGLDPDLIVRKIKKEMGIVEEKSTPLAEPKSSAAIKHRASQTTRLVGKAAVGTLSFMHKNWKWMLGSLVVVAAIIVIAIFAFSYGSGGGGSAQPQTAEAAAPARAEPAYGLPVKESFGAENRGTADIILQANAETWLQIKDANGEILFSRVMSAGDVYYVPNAESRATVGNAGGLDVWVRGEPAPKLGARGVKKSGILLTPDALTGAPAPVND